MKKKIVQKKRIVQRISEIFIFHKNRREREKSTCTWLITWWSRYCKFAFFNFENNRNLVNYVAQTTTIVLQCRLRAIDCDRQLQQLYEFWRHQTTRCRRVQRDDVLFLRSPLRIRNGFSILYRYTSQYEKINWSFD